jgi:hypothetical protein
MVLLQLQPDSRAGRIRINLGIKAAAEASRKFSDGENHVAWPFPNVPRKKFNRRPVAPTESHEPQGVTFLAALHFLRQVVVNNLRFPRDFVSDLFALC